MAAAVSVLNTSAGTAMAKTKSERPFARAVAHEPREPRGKAKGDQAEDRQDDGENVQHRDARTAVTG